ncbi:MAG: cyclopropane-fatty-acyl-phospholipid synthase family protein [Sandaracinaceae bacterium]|nr:cyclopropane-fatty-acyl-phospholipid synthase family protein [Sandaracinaceae bacterium]
MGASPACTVTFRSARAFRACVASGDPTPLAEAYVAGDVSIHGDVGAAVELGLYLAERAAGAPAAHRSAGVSTERTVRSPDADARDERTHYDHPEELFRSSLDERMVYSCAYFAHPDQSLEEAQTRKLDLICRKLQLRPGERLLDVGCGWGALVLWAAERYGVSALGITLSESQAAEARRRVAHAGLTDRVTIAVRHYRDLGAEVFDKVSSVGMYEHVGHAHLDAYISTIERVLRPGGLFLNHGITLPSTAARPSGDFIFRHVFPGAALQPLSTICAAMERAGLELLDVQSLRPHYALTLREWAHRFRVGRADTSTVPERARRTWDLYLAGCAYAFDQGLVGVHQVLAGKLDHARRTDTPLTREELLLGIAPPRSASHAA